MASGQKTNTGPRRRPPTRDEIIKGVLDSYHPARGPVPFATLWGDLVKTGWLKRFAQEIAEYKYRIEAWNMMNKECNTSFIIEHLYLLTIPGKFAERKRTGANKAFKTQIKKISQKYDKLRDDIFSLVQIRPLLLVLPPGHVLREELQKLQVSKQHLEALRGSSKKLGWKRARWSFYLYLLADEVRRGTGQYHVEELANLIDSAHAAHDEPSKFVSVEKLSRAISRFKEKATVVTGRPRFPSRRR
jgi:hypothetical protein